MVARISGTSLLTRRSALAAFSQAMEEECRRVLPGTHLFGAYHRVEAYLRAREVWAEFAARARSTCVFADFGGVPPSERGAAVEVDLGPLTGPREWAFVADRQDGPMVLAARERPGQDHLEPEERLFDSAWSTDPPAVRQVARIYANVARAAGAPGSAGLVHELSFPPLRPEPDPAFRDLLLDRLLALIEDPDDTVVPDRPGERPRP